MKLKLLSALCALAAAAALSAAAQTAAAPSYTGERVSINLKNADLGDFFRLIHEISGLNLVVDPNVKGSVTLDLDNVPWDQAVAVVLHNNQLAEQREGNVVRIATLKTLEDEDRQTAQARRAKENAAPLVTSYRTLSYTKATDVAALLNNSRPATSAGNSATPDTGTGLPLAGPSPGAAPGSAAPDLGLNPSPGFGLLCERCTVTADPRTNTLVVQSPADYLPRLDALLAKLDTRTPQIEVEARVVETSNSFSKELGMQLGIGGGNSTTAVTGVGALGNSSTVVSGLNPSYPTNGGTLPWNVNLGASAPTSGLGFITATNSYRIDAVLSAAESKGLGKVLSRPEVITQNNTQAVVQQGVKIPVQTTINNTISVQFFNVTLELQVTPQITADGNIFLNVSIINDQIDPSIARISGIPAIDTQQTTTNVLIADGGTVVIGGVMITNTQNNVDQVPLLGSMPILGNAFKHTTVSDETQELLFFLTPKVIPADGLPAAPPAGGAQ